MPHKDFPHRTLPHAGNVRKLVRPGPTKPGGKSRTALAIQRNSTNTLARIQVVVQGHVMGEAIMNARTLEQFIAACQHHLSRLKEGPSPAGVATIKTE
jgi:hypothetical protein